jgi:hypothetical protein
MYKTVQIIPAKVETMPYYEGKPAQSEFWFDGQAYILNGNQMKSVPYQVADNWVAHDSNVRIVNDR